MKKQSIKRQMIAVFICMIVCMIGAMWIINVRFLEPYYVRNKQTEFIKMYKELRTAVKKDNITDATVSNRIQKMAEKNNISFLVLDNSDSDSDDVSIITNVHDKDLLRKQLMGYLLNQAQKNGKVLSKKKNYQIRQTKEPWTQTEYIEMWGKFSDGENFLIRSPLESIKESVQLSNQFLLYIGAVALIICAILVWFFSKRLTAPVRELATLSEKMANQDFEAKYTGGGPSEIAELGENFNQMSWKLERSISDLKSANNNLQKDIEQKEKLEQMRNDFLGNVSHELKTPLALIQGYAEGLKDGVTSDPESMEFYCDVIIDEAGKMNKMVRNLLTLNQLEFGDEDITFERFDLTAVIRGVIQSMDIMAQQDGATVNFRQDEPVYVWADEFKVEQVIRNYMSNAFHHLDGEKIVEVKIHLDENRAKVTVFNTGTPIPEEDLAHIWDKFYKVDKAHTREYGGNGIGLSIVKAIMESFHQEYGVKNYENGVEFWFTLDRK